MRKSSFKLFGFMLFIFGSIINFNAQNKSSEKDVEQEKKVTYLKDKLKLTDSENKAFWPVYHQKYLDLKANSRFYKSQKIDKKISEMSEEECKKMMELKLAKDSKELEIEKLYHEKFVALIGYKKTAKLYKEEDDYKDELKQKEATKKSFNKSK
jgi:hypothetical protein